MSIYNLDEIDADGKRIILQTNNATILAILNIDVVIRTQTSIVILIEDKFFLDYFIKQIDLYLDEGLSYQYIWITIKIEKIY